MFDVILVSFLIYPCLRFHRSLVYLGLVCVIRKDPSDFPSIAFLKAKQNTISNSSNQMMRHLLRG